MRHLSEGLNTVLQNMQPTLNETTTPADTCQNGLKTGDGKMTIQRDRQVQHGSGREASTNGRELSLQATTQISLKDDPDSKTRLNEALLMAFDGLNTYGKEPEQLENAKKLFHFALADYPWERIRPALAFHFKYNKEFPVPADIVQIIERGNKPPFERAVYVSISKKDPQHRTSDEWAYMRDYESWMVNG